MLAVGKLDGGVLENTVYSFGNFCMSEFIVRVSVWDLLPAPTDVWDGGFMLTQGHRNLFFLQLQGTMERESDPKVGKSYPEK